MPRPLHEIITHIRMVIANPQVSTTLVQTEDLEVLCAAAERAETEYKRGIEALALANKLRVRAIAVVSDAPYWKYVSEVEWSRVTIDHDTATLHWCKADGYYDSPTLEGESCNFPASMLFISDDDLAAWKIEQDRLYDQQQAAKRASNIKKAEAAERATFDALKRKFEPR